MRSGPGVEQFEASCPCRLCLLRQLEEKFASVRTPAEPLQAIAEPIRLSIFDGLRFCLGLARAKASPVRNLIDNGISVQDPPPWMRSAYFHPLALAAMTIAMFGAVLFWLSDRGLSHLGDD